MRQIYLVLLFSILFQKTALSQVSAVSEKIKASDLLAKGEELERKNKDSAYYYFDKAYTIYKKNKNWLGCIHVLQEVNYTSGYHFQLHKYRETIDLVDSILKKNATYFDSIKGGLSAKNYQLIEKTNYYNKIKDYKKSRYYAVKLSDRIDNIPTKRRSVDDIENLCIAYEYEALALTNEGKYNESEQLYLKCIRIALNKLDEDFALPTYRLLGDLYGKQGKYEKGNQYLRKGLNHEIKKGVNSKNKIVKSCYAIAKNYIKINNIDSAQHYLSIANKQLLPDDIPLKYQYYKILGELKFSNRDYEESIIALDTSLALIQSDEPELSQIEISRIYCIKAKVFDEMKKYQEAIKNYDNALKELTGDFESNELTKSIALDKIQDEYEYLRILKEKVNTLMKAKSFNKAWDASLGAIALMDVLKPGFQNENDKTVFDREFFILFFESGLASIYELYVNSNDDNYIEDAFFLAEKSKSVILMEALLNAHAYQFSQIPNYLIEKENQLKETINYLDKKVKKNKSKFSAKKTKKQKQSKLIEDQLFDTKKEYKELIKGFEAQFPNYYKLKYDNKVITLKDFQNSLDDKVVAVSYFFGEKELYAFMITKNSKELIKIHCLLILTNNYSHSKHYLLILRLILIC